MTFTDFFIQLYIFLRFASPIFICCLLFMKFFPKKDKFWLRFCILTAFYILISVFLNYIDYCGYLAFGWFHFNFLMIFGLVNVVMYFVFDIKPKELIFFTITAYCLQHFGDDIGSIILNYISNANIYLQIIVYVLSQAIIYTLSYFLIIKPRNINGKLALSDPFLFGIAVISLGSVYVISMYRYSEETVFSFSSYFYDMVACLTLVLVQLRTFEQSNMKFNEEILNTVISQSHFQEKNAKENIELINIKCHDFKKQISRLNTLGDVQGKNELIDELSQVINFYDCNIKTGNETLDTILTEKNFVCQSKKIQMITLCDGNCLSFMEKSDIYSLFSNALDNAIEELVKLKEEDRIISIDVKKMKAGIGISIDNTLGTKVEFENGLPKTTKGSENWHGFGTKSIKYIAKKYHGECSFKAENNHFTVRLVFLDTQINKPSIFK